MDEAQARSGASRAARRMLKSVLGLTGHQTRAVLSGPARGLVFCFDMSSHVGLWLGLYEIELNRHLRKAFSPGLTTLDVGGQFGYDALLASKCTQATTYTFECDPKYCSVIAENVRRNPGLRAQVHVVEAFVGNGSQGSLRIDDFVAERDLMVGALKVDIEGGELNALEGARELLAKQGPAVVVEVHTPELRTQCAKLLESVGYSVRHVRTRRWLPDHRPDSAFAGWLVGHKYAQRKPTQA